jgi:hypothetical protein
LEEQQSDGLAIIGGELPATRFKFSGDTAIAINVVAVDFARGEQVRYRSGRSR